MIKREETRLLVEGFDYIRINPDKHDGKKFRLIREVRYLTRYGKLIIAKVDYEWDGATGAKDLEGSMSHLIHDVLCDNAVFEDGTRVSNWQASCVLKDILKSEGYWIRKYSWFVVTFLLGGRKIKKKNGWFFSWRS
jgi:hypothetical protein